MKELADSIKAIMVNFNCSIPLSKMFLQFKLLEVIIYVVHLLFIKLLLLAKQAENHGDIIFSTNSKKNKFVLGVLQN